ncbi:MAG: 6-phosphofructokinase [Candidatus Omnitrophica bacterium]|nr:6-phosphofructokinase [Candidatus Omnitrophota bacterium]
MKRIGVLTAGGDAPGMNAAIRSVVRYSLYRGVEIMGIFRGYAGLINEEMKLFNHHSVSNIVNHGGTILKTARCPEFMTKEGRKRAADVVKRNNIDGLVLIGGNGTYQGAIELVKEHRIPCIGVPGTIDNDINGTDSTIGSDTAVNTALEAIDKIRDTATSMERIFVVEVMGRDSGFIAMQVGLGGGAEDVLVPERKFDIDAMCHDMVEGNIRGKISWIIVVAEGAAKAGDVAKKITDMTSLETRVVVLGHIQRGGSPTARSRILGATLGAAAVDLLIKGESGKAVGVISNELNIVDLETAVKPRPTKISQLYELLKVLT